MPSLSRAFSIADMRRLACRALPPPIRHYLEGGADDEWTMRRNTEAFERWALVPRALVDVAAIDASTPVLGMKSSLPLMLSPTGMSQLFHHSGELAVARGAAAMGVPYTLSTMATTSMEVIAQTGVTRAFQLYVFRDRALTSALLERAQASGYGTLCLTVDTALAGNRERDLRTGMVMPPRLTLRSWAGFAAHPRWSLARLRAGPFRLANVTDHVGDLGADGTGVIDYVNRQFDRSATWSDLEWLRAQWPGKLVVKGLVAPDDCARAVACGADGIMVSNHGGRQLDAAVAPVEMVPAIRDRIGGEPQLIVDGGVRRGTHILKAVALGANGCSIGRPYLYGLAAGGEGESTASCPFSAMRSCATWRCSAARAWPI